MALGQSVRDEQLVMEGVGQCTWRRLSSLLAEKTGSWVQDKCLQAFHVGRAFVEKKVLSVRKAYPWKLPHGDRAQNLRDLATVEGLQDELTMNIQCLVKANYNDNMLLEGAGTTGGRKVDHDLS